MRPKIAESELPNNSPAPQHNGMSDTHVVYVTQEEVYRRSDNVDEALKRIISRYK